MKPEQQKRKMISKGGGIVLLLLIAVSALLVWLLTPKGDAIGTAQIMLDGKCVKTIDLSTAKDNTFTLENCENVHFEIKNHQIRFVNVNCPDHLCAQFGFISQPGRTAVCMPNRVSVTIVGTGAKTDGIVN